MARVIPVTAIKFAHCGGNRHCPKVDRHRADEQFDAAFRVIGEAICVASYAQARVVRGLFFVLVGHLVNCAAICRGSIPTPSGQVVTQVIASLDEAAAMLEWKALAQRSRQGELFQ
jgi:hypothetical protein